MVAPVYQRVIVREVIENGSLVAAMIPLIRPVGYSRHVLRPVPIIV